MLVSEERDKVKEDIVQNILKIYKKEDSYPLWAMLRNAVEDGMRAIEGR